MVYRAPETWLSSWLPPRCLLCGERGSAGREACAACLAALPVMTAACVRCALPLAPDEGAAMLCGGCQRRPSPLHQTVASFVYAWPIDVLLRRFKFHQDLAAGRLLAALMLERCAALPRPQALVPVSLHRQRLRWRGYDQALELARPLARALTLPCLPLLQRTRPTRPQSELDATARARNLRDAFRGQGTMPAHLTLIDDVMTTGATLYAAARALHRAGAQRIDAWVCARVR